MVGGLTKEKKQFYSLFFGAVEQADKRVMGWHSISLCRCHRDTTARDLRLISCIKMLPCTLMSKNSLAECLSLGLPLPGKKPVSMLL